MLTVKQKELLEYVSDFINSNKVSPSYDEIREAMNLKSKSGIHRIVLALEERGFIRKLANRARAIEVLKNPNLSEWRKTCVKGDFARNPCGTSHCLLTSSSGLSSSSSLQLEEGSMVAQSYVNYFILLYSQF